MDLKDNRYKWLIETISNILGIYDTKYAIELIENNPNEFHSFLNDEIQESNDIHKQIIFLWRTFYDKMIEETITVLEEGIFIQ